ncbi:MAG: LacI family DNA-binding transcriptional regulator [Pseudomonadota bacterium]
MTASGKDRAKIEDVARVAGVSIMSVSRAMRGVDGVSAASRQRILAIARDLGYTPSRVAGSLAGATSNLIGISVPTLFDAVFAEIIEGMRASVLHAGYETIIETSD